MRDGQTGNNVGRLHDGSYAVTAGGETYRARTLVGADGANGVVATALGFERPTDGAVAIEANIAYEDGRGAPQLARHRSGELRTVDERPAAHPNGAHFVLPGGKPEAPVTLSQQVSAILAARVGIQMTPHQFRHVAAVFYLEDHPEDFETVRELLGHAWSKTTRIYAGNGSKRASRAFGDFVVAQRDKLRLKGKRPRRLRRK